ncbi:MAG: hypothetical protein ACHQ50_01015 [Fimbriimonadales bacterium]
MLADLFPTTIDERGVLLVMLVITAAVLLVVGIAIAFFARWSKREKARRKRDVNTAMNLRR